MRNARNGAIELYFHLQKYMHTIDINTYVPSWMKASIKSKSLLKVLHELYYNGQNLDLLYIRYIIFLE